MTLMRLSPDLLTGARDRASMTQRAAANVLGVTERTLRAWEKGEHPAPADAAATLASLYGVTIDSLFVHEKNDPTFSTGCEEDVKTQAPVAVSGKSSATRAR